jgi:hypothetical protein
MTTLQEQIAKLTAKHELNEFAKSVLGDMDFLAFLSFDDQKRIVVKAKDKDEFKKVFELFPPTNEKQIIGTATDKFHTTLNVPFRMGIDNPASPNQWYYHTLKVRYSSNEFDVEITLPIAFIEGFTNTSERNISDSEYHYFIGYSDKQLRELRVRKYNFKSGKQISWYGGDVTNTNETEIMQIIEHLTQ